MPNKLVEPEIQIQSTGWFGLDLGQLQDFTALIGVQRTEPIAIPVKAKILDQPDEMREETTYSAGMGKVTTVTVSRPQPQPKPTLPKTFIERLKSRFYIVKGIHRFGENTKYDMVIDFIMEMAKRPPLQGATLAIDYTGVGVGIVDMLVRYRPKCKIVPIMITAGSGASIRPNGYGSAFSGFNVAKKELVTISNIIMQARRIRFEKEDDGTVQPLAKILADEMQHFTAKITAHANESYESWREKDHDDLVLALSIALWASEKGQQRLWVR